MHFKGYSGEDCTWTQGTKKAVTIGFYLFCVVTLAVTGTVLKLMPTTAKPKSTKTPVENLGNLTAAIDNYLLNNGNTTNVTSKYGPNIGAWDVSKLKEFTGAFSATRNPAIGLYDPKTANFALFNVSKWNTTNATSFAYMFQGTKFNGNCSTWKVAQAHNFTGMFENAAKFNGTDLYKWNLTNATDLSHMFRGADSFTGVGVIEKWTTGKVVNMKYMFARNGAMTANVAGFDVSNVKMFDGMFEDADNFTGAGVEGWNVSSAVTMNWMFANTELFNADLSAWDVSSVESMKDESAIEDGMFCDAKMVSSFPSWVGLNSFCGSEDALQSDLPAEVAANTTASNTSDVAM